MPEMRHSCVLYRVGLEADPEVINSPLAFYDLFDNDYGRRNERLKTSVQRNDAKRNNIFETVADRPLPTD